MSLTLNTSLAVRDGTRWNATQRNAIERVHCSTHAGAEPPSLVGLSLSRPSPVVNVGMSALRAPGAHGTTEGANFGL